MAAKNRHTKLVHQLGDQMKRTRILIAVLLLALHNHAKAQSLPSPQKTVAEQLGYPADSRLLIIHAQDMGMAHSIDTATFEALEKGWVTSGSILVPCPWFPEVVRWAKNHPNADLGIRLDMNASYPWYRWGPVSEQKPGSGLLDADGYLPAAQQYVARRASQEEVRTEAHAQIEKARKAGVSISHIDNYAKVLILTPALFQVYAEMGQEYKVPIVFPRRQLLHNGTAQSGTGMYTIGNTKVDIRDFPMDGVLEIFSGYTKKDWLSVYENTLAALPPGVYQLSVHLGHDSDELRAVTGNDPQWGSEWRQNDFDVVSNPEFQKFLKDKSFILIGWKDLKKLMPAEARP